MNRYEEIKIEIQDPCQEPWDKMRNAAGGRFCDRCTKVVVDATSLSPEEIFSVYREKNGNVCMRLSSDILERPLIIPTHQRKFFSSFWHKAILFIGIQLTFFQQLKAQVKNAMGDMKPADDAEKKYLRSAVIKGSVADSLESEPLYLVEVVAMKGDSIIASGYTDLNGNFELKLTDSLPVDSRIDLRLRRRDYDTKTIKGFLINKETVFLDTLKIHRTAILLKEVVVRNTRETFTSGLPVVHRCYFDNINRIAKPNLNGYFPNSNPAAPQPVSPKINSPEGSQEWFNDRQ